MTQRNSQNGFTLIELLVVVSIIALLVSILLPALSNARAQAQKVVCASNLHQFTLAMVTYAEDYNGSLPYHYATGWHVHDIPKTFFEMMQDDYGLKLEHFVCPSKVKYESTIIADNENSSVSITSYLFLMPRALGYYNPDGNYEMPPKTNIPGTSIVVLDPDPDNYIGPKKLSDPRGKTNPVMADDITFRTTFPLSYSHTLDVMETPQGQAGINWERTVPNHRRKDGYPDSMNHAFIDGHVDRVSPYDTRPRYRYGNSNPYASIWW